MFKPQLFKTPNPKLRTSSLSASQRYGRAIPKTSPSRKHFEYKYKTMFQEEFRDGNFEANDYDLMNLNLESWVPILKQDIDKIKHKNPKKSAISDYFTDEELDLMEDKVLNMITDAYRNEMPNICPHLIENQEILAKYRKKHKIKYGQDYSAFHKNADKQKLIQQIMMIKQDIADVKKHNEQLRNHIDLLEKAKSQAILARGGIIAQANYAENTSPFKSNKVLKKVKPVLDD